MSNGKQVILNCMLYMLILSIYDMISFNKHGGSQTDLLRLSPKIPIPWLFLPSCKSNLFHADPKIDLCLHSNPIRTCAGSVCFAPNEAPNEG